MRSATLGTIDLVANGTGLSSRTGSALLALMAQRLGPQTAFAGACGYPEAALSAINQAVGEQILALEENAWAPAVNHDGQPREGADESRLGMQASTRRHQPT
jgi:hypothetical protein